METDITLAVSKEVPKSKFEICVKENEQLLVKFQGTIEELVDSFIGVGIIRKMEIQGDSVYLVINEEDLDKFISDPDDYDISG